MKKETFELFGTKWPIVDADSIESNEPDVKFQWGLTDYVNRRICIALKDTEGMPFPKEEI